jgi:hypothetical protein
MADRPAEPKCSDTHLAASGATRRSGDLRSFQLAREVAALEADEADRVEMLAVASLMEAMRAAR